MRQRVNFVISLIAVLAIWELAARYGGLNRLLLPSPAAVAGAVASLVTTPAGLRAIGSTLTRFGIGLLFGTLGGILLGSALGLVPVARRTLFPWVEFFRSIPASAFIPLLLLSFGIGNTSRLILISVIVGLLMAISTMASLMGCSPTKRLAGKSLGLSPQKLFFSVTLPETLPGLSTAFRLAISFSLILTVLGEMSIGGKVHGLGRTMQDAQLVYETPTLYAAIIVAGALGYLLNSSYALLERSLVHWRGK